MLGAIRRLFGGGDREAAEGNVTAGAAVEYKGFRIIPQPRRQGGGFLTAGVIVHETPEGRREHHFVRADTHTGADEARQFTIQKAQRLIDEQGLGLFKS